MKIARINNKFKIMAPERGIKLIVDVDKVDEAVMYLRTASEFYRENSPEPQKRRKERAAAAPVEEPEAEATTKDKVLFKIRIKNEEGEVTKFADVRSWLEAQLSDGPKHLDYLAALLAPYARTTSGAKLTQEKRLSKARASIRTFGINPRVKNISMNDEGELELASVDTDEE